MISTQRIIKPNESSRKETQDVNDPYRDLSKLILVNDQKGVRQSRVRKNEPSFIFNADQQQDLFSQADNSLFSALKSENKKPQIEEEEKKEEIEEVEYLAFRDKLPAPKDSSKKQSWFKIMKDAIGKDISKFSVPVTFNEPLSMLQKVSEIMEYEQTLVEANLETDALVRLMKVTAFGISQFKAASMRLAKPFNPLLGETFELCCEKYKYIGEQVSHHPPISASHAFSDHYEYFMDSFTKMNFTGTNMKAIP